jgi:hypothetical protein
MVLILAEVARPDHLRSVRSNFYADSPFEYIRMNSDLISFCRVEGLVVARDRYL